MSNVAVIFAGGTGQRMNTRTRPKQFLELHGKPIIVYTLEVFDQHKEIDGIVLVMLESWIGYTEELVRKYGLKKVRKIVPGGASGQESIYNGLKGAAEFYGDEDIVLIHDGVRPLIDEDTITENIRSVKERGTAITVTAAIETITMKDQTGAVGTIIDRSQCQLARAPQSFRLGHILGVHDRARQEEGGADRLQWKAGPRISRSPRRAITIFSAPWSTRERARRSSGSDLCGPFHDICFVDKLTGDKRCLLIPQY